VTSRFRFVLVLGFLCFLSLAVEAQISTCKTQVVCSVYNLYYADCVPPLPPGASNCQWNGPWSAVCDIPTYQCSPAPCPTCNAPKGGGPIDLATGNTDIQQSDVALPGLGGGLTLSRTWNSQTVAYGKFGLGWSSNLEERVYVGGDGLIKNARGDGSIWSYGWSSYSQDGSGSVYYLAGPRNGGSTLQVNPTTWTLTLNSGEKKTFDRMSGSLLSMVDRNGNTTQVSYDGTNHRITVTDPASRHLYLTYSSVSVGNFYVDLVTSVTSDFGVSLSYQYDAIGRLVKVTKPDTTFLTFEYGAGDLITAVKDRDGKLLESHTYDLQGRGVTSSRAGGIDALTVSYQP
jgi:YD repeat-containing protein